MQPTVLSWITALGLLLAPVVTGVSTLAAVRMTERANRRRHAEQERAVADEKIEAVTTELTRATFTLLSALATQQPRWNSWKPRLLTLGQACLELQAGRSTLGLAYGMTRASQVVLDWHERSMAAAEDLVGTPYRQFTDAVSQAVLLPDEDLVAAVLGLAEAAAAAAAAYGADNLYQAKTAAAGRQAADAALQEALAAVTRVARERLRPPAPTPQRRWRWRWRRTRR
ncbi:hypothetical protein [Micromonospora sp. NPDC048063]|uniref:hypothetical protein n=1 Tax=Micromonospora sp. NPDC048063 TaxID=3364256 RepID=UPI0037124C2B